MALLKKSQETKIPNNMATENKNYDHLADEAEGAYLKKDYLEAFLIQSCIIEGVIKNYATAKLTPHLNASPTLKHKMDSIDLARIIDFLLIANKIDNRLYENLNKYRKKRNEVIHNLLEYEDKAVLDAELKSAYELGRDMKGLIVEDMRTVIFDGGTMAELQAQITALLGQIVELQGEMVAANPDSRNAIAIQHEISKLQMELMDLSDSEVDDLPKN